MCDALLSFHYVIYLPYLNNIAHAQSIHWKFSLDFPTFWSFRCQPGCPYTFRVTFENKIKVILSIPFRLTAAFGEHINTYLNWRKFRPYNKKT